MSSSRFRLKMSITDFIAVLSLLVAATALFYSRQAVGESRRQTNISKANAVLDFSRYLFEQTSNFEKEGKSADAQVLQNLGLFFTKKLYRELPAAEQKKYIEMFVEVLGKPELENEIKRFLE